MVILDTINSAEHKQGRIRQVALDKWCHPKGGPRRRRHRRPRGGAGVPGVGEELCDTFPA